MVTAAIDGVIWMIVVGFIIAFILSFALGANDAANSLGTSVGSKVLTLTQAYAVGCIFETLGAVLVGSKVADTIRKGIIDVELYEGKEKLLMVGQIAALAACAIWLFAATALKLPVSATHSIVGATLGFHLVVFGVEGVYYMEIVKIVISWLSSPLLSGLISVGTFFVLRYSFIIKESPLEPGLKTLPFWYAIVFFVNSFSVFYNGPKLLKFDKIPLWGTFVICFGGGLLVALFVWFVFVPYIRKSAMEDEQPILQNVKDLKRDSIEEPPPDDRTYDTFTDDKSDSQYDKVQETHNDDMLNTSRELSASEKQLIQEDRHKTDAIIDEDDNKTGCLSAAGKGLVKVTRTLSGPDGPGPIVKDHPHVVKLCAPLQILSAMFAAFSHGGNDVSNAIAPLVALWLIYSTGDAVQKEETPLWILFYGAVGMSIGLCVLGKRVIETIGEDLTTLTPSSGFSVEFGAATTVLVASNLGIPISSTQCKVGSVVAVGWARDRRAGAVNWKLFRNIILSWIVTLPCTMGLSAGLMALLRMTV